MMRIVLAIVLLASMVIAGSGMAAAQSVPRFNLGFETLADLLGPGVAGQPLENEHYGANGDSLQQTTTGLMVWRKADNWTAFTDGTTTWINGPLGLQSRPNAERFPWEQDAPRVQDFAPFAGDWGRHGFGMTLTRVGTAELYWRTYQWCGPGVSGACDRIEGNMIVGGGRSSITFNRIDGPTAYGQVTYSSDTPVLGPGPVSFTLLPYGLGRLDRADGSSTILCGPSYLDEAPEEIRNSYPCGA